MPKTKYHKKQVEYSTDESDTGKMFNLNDNYSELDLMKIICNVYTKYFG